MATKEHQRLASITEQNSGWRRWGPYVSDRAWGTVREDYSADGDAWSYLPHDKARSKAYRWGEDGLAGICDRYQIMTFAPAFWNGEDPILKERLFGLSNPQGNHGEDVKEYYFYLDNVPTHSYMKYLYKYPHQQYPYQHLIEENGRRSSHDMEYELLDTGIFDEDRYFDIFVEYAKAGPEDIIVRIEAFNRGPDAHTLHVLPHMWFRNTWSWTDIPGTQPIIRMGPPTRNAVCLVADDSTATPLSNVGYSYSLGLRYLYGQNGGETLFTDNETNVQHVYGAEPQWAKSQYTKDAFHRYVVDGEAGAVNPQLRGTKSTLHYKQNIPGKGSAVIYLRLTDTQMNDPLGDVEAIMKQARKEADEFYAVIHPPKATADEKNVQRQAYAGMLWSKQIYMFDVARWLDGDSVSNPPPPGRGEIRNGHWRHLNSMRIMSMPDKWEYPWFAAWDLAFHTVPLCNVDPEFAKEQLWLLLFEQFQHINGQIPAYEWEFSDLNPPVQAWALWRIYNMDRTKNGGKGDLAFLERCFHKLLINFTWWVNRVDSAGNNIFEGGFLGLDNIAVLDRSMKFSDGTKLEQSDATGWMGMFCLSLMRIALDLAKNNPVYESLATKFFEHYVYVGAAMKHMGGRDFGLWSERDGFFYDVLRYPNGEFHKFRVRSLVGLIPLYAVERLEEEWITPFKSFRWNVHWFLKNKQDLVQRCIYTINRESDGQAVHVLAVANEEQLTAILERVWDKNEFRSPHGLRSLSKFHEEKPFRFEGAEVRYECAESPGKIKGGNSNWRGPVWFPTSFLMIESLRRLGKAYGPSFTVPDPEKKGGRITLEEMAHEMSNDMISIFTRGKDGKRPCHGGNKKFQEDPHWKDYVLFYEYFHGDNGAGLGAAHQTGWTGLVATLIDEARQ